MASIRKVTLRGYGPKSVNAAWREREDFDANGSLRGITYAQGTMCGHLSGRLNDEERRRFVSDCHAGIAFLVVSYATPIAWVLHDGTEYKVQQRFSVTTSRHAGSLY